MEDMSKSKSKSWFDNLLCKCAGGPWRKVPLTVSKEDCGCWLEWLRSDTPDACRGEGEGLGREEVAPEGSKRF